jgi:putative oxidoreductase
MTLGLLILRVVVGLALAAHGSQKLFGAFGGGGIQGTGAFFEQHLRFKPGNVYATMAGATELGAGLALALGFFTPVASAAVIGTMIVAGVAAHKDNGFFITRGGYEYTLILGTVASALAFVGPGRLSVDRALGWDLYGVVWGIVATVFGAVFGMCVLAGRGRLVDGDELEEEVDDFAVEGGREEALERGRSREEAER